MDRRHAALVMAATFAAGCGVARSSEEDQKQALERRVAELEQKLAQAQGEKPAAQPLSEPSAGAMDLGSEERAVRRAQSATRTSMGSRPAPRANARPDQARAPEPAPAPVVDAQADVPSAEPMEAKPVVPPPSPVIRIPNDTTLHLVLEGALSSEHSHAGETVVARVESAVSDEGEITLPGGSCLEGRVLSAQPSGRVKGKARLQVGFDHIVVRGSRYPLQTTGVTLEAEDSHMRDAAMVGGGTVVGAILGKVVGGSATKGAVLGGVAGGGAVLATKGKEVSLPAGGRVTVRVTRSRDIEG
jgi:hypothetical protein